jgi:hypothetical protein
MSLCHDEFNVALLKVVSARVGQGRAEDIGQDIVPTSEIGASDDSDPVEWFWRRCDLCVAQSLAAHGTGWIVVTPLGKTCDVKGVLAGKCAVAGRVVDRLVADRAVVHGKRFCCILGDFRFQS